MICISANRFGGEGGDDGAFASTFKAAIIALGKHVQVLYDNVVSDFSDAPALLYECRNFTGMDWCGTPKATRSLLDRHLFNNTAKVDECE